MLQNYIHPLHLPSPSLATTINTISVYHYKTMPSATATKKRKAESSANIVVVESRPKKSPLAGLPQNYYAPPPDLTPDQLTTWRKEQRKERNRQSAAASRLQTKHKIQTLEGERDEYKRLYEEMKCRMEGMERKIQWLMALTNDEKDTMTIKEKDHQVVAVPQVSYPSSPTRPFSPRDCYPEKEEQPRPRDSVVHWPPMTHSVDPQDNIVSTTVDDDTVPQVPLSNANQEFFPPGAEEAVVYPDIISSQIESISSDAISNNNNADGIVLASMYPKEEHVTISRQA